MPFSFSPGVPVFFSASGPGVADDDRPAAFSFFAYTVSARSSSLTAGSYETTRSKSMERLRVAFGASDFQLHPTLRSVS